MSIKKRLISAVAAVILAVGTLLVVPQTASASTSVNMNLVCQENMGRMSWAAKLVNGNNVYGWRCWNRAYPGQYWLGPFFSADVNGYCKRVEVTSAHYTNYNNPNSWRCR